MTILKAPVRWTDLIYPDDESAALAGATGKESSGERATKQPERNITSTPAQLNYSPETELAVIGAAIALPEANDGLAVVEPGWFVEPAHRHCWQAIQRCKRPGMIEVCDELRNAGQDVDVPMVHHAVDLAPVTASEAWYHVGRLRNLYRNRQLVQLGLQLKDADAACDPDSMIEAAVSRLEKLAVNNRPANDGRSLADFAYMEINHAETLLGQRYLCRGGSMLFVGPSGIGKSSASCQQDMLWALGREAFGVAPARPLRILCFQAENDDGDQHEMTAGVMRGLRLSDTEMTLVHENTRYLTRFETGQAFLIMMDRELRAWPADLVRIDPLNAFIGDDAKEPKAIAFFCRSGINPILARHRCGMVVAHHTPKVGNRDTSSWTALEWAYAGSGGADLTNWARAVMVVDPVNLAAGVFKFIGAKRGARIGWVGSDDEKVIERHFGYAREPGLIYWRDADPWEITVALKANPKAKRTPDDLLEFVPPFGELVGKSDLLEKAINDLPCGEKKAGTLLRVLIERGNVYEHHEKRSGKRDAVFIGRHPPLKPMVEKP